MGFLDFLGGKKAMQPAQPTPQAGGPLRLVVDKIYNITGVGAVLVGKIESGVMRAGARVRVDPPGAVAAVRAIEKSHQTVDSAQAGDSVGFTLDPDAGAQPGSVVTEA